MRLAQISEFCLVMTYIGMSLGHVGSAVGSAVVLAFVATAVLTPALFAHSDGLHRRLSPLLDRLGLSAPGEGSPQADDHGAPRLVLLGNFLAAGYPFIRSTLQAELDRRVLPASRRLVRVAPTSLSEDAPLLGAAELAFEPLLNDPAAWLQPRQLAVARLPA